MHANFFSFLKMQLCSFSQIVWLQLLCIALVPMFFRQINSANDLSNVIIFVTGLIMPSYLLLRNFAYNDAKYKTKYLFGILPVTPKIIIGARGLLIYLFCLTAAPLLLLFSGIAHAIKPDLFAVINISLIPFGLLLITVFMPMEFLIFYIFEAQKADIIAALAPFLYMLFAGLLYRYTVDHFLWVLVLIAALLINVLCFSVSVQLYQKKNL